MEVEWPRIRYIKYTDNFSTIRDDYCTCMLPWANKYTYEIKREGREIYDNALNLTNRMATKKLNWLLYTSFLSASKVDELQDRICFDVSMLMLLIMYLIGHITQ